MPALNTDKKIDTSAPQHTTAKPIQDWEAAKAHLENVKKTGFDLKLGKSGNNPYMWVARVLAPLESELKGGSRSDELFNKIMSVPIPSEKDTLI